MAIEQSGPLAFQRHHLARVINNQDLVAVYLFFNVGRTRRSWVSTSLEDLLKALANALELREPHAESLYDAQKLQMRRQV